MGLQGSLSIAHSSLKYQKNKDKINDIHLHICQVASESATHGVSHLMLQTKLSLDELGKLSQRKPEIF